MEFLIDGEHDSNIQINQNRGEKNLINERRKNKINPDVNSNAPVFFTKEQRERMVQDDLKKKDEEEKKRHKEIKQHLNEYLKSKYEDNSRNEKHRHSRSNSRDKKRRERSRERDGHKREKDTSDKNENIIDLQENEKEEIKVINILIVYFLDTLFRLK